MLVDIANFKSPRNVVKQSSNVSSSSYVMSVQRFLLVEFSFFFYFDRTFLRACDNDVSFSMG